MRSRSAGSVSASNRSIIAFGHRQQLEEAAEEPGFLGVGADDERHPVRLAVAHRLDRVQRQVLGAAGRARRERAEHLALARDDQSVERARPARRGGPPSPPAPRPPAAAPSSAANSVGVLRPRPRECAPFRRPGSPKSPGRKVLWPRERPAAWRRHARPRSRRRSSRCPDRRRTPRCCRAPSAAPSPGPAGTGCRRR